MRFLVPALAAAGLIIGIVGAMLIPESWIIAPPDQAAGETGEVWACPMLCVKKDKPGTCPVCGMDLEKLEDTGDAVVVDHEQEAMIGLETATAEQRPLNKTIRTFGEIHYNERRVRTISAWVDGRIERLYADHTYADVRAGDHVLQLYSPGLYSAQEELLAGGTTREAARKKLSLLGLSEAQILALEKTGKASEFVDILSPITGKVIDLKVTQGAYVKEGAALYTVADFSSFWLRFDAYEADLPWLALGQHVEISLDAVPGRVFEGSVSFIEGVVQPRTRTTKVRVTVDNADLLLRPGMFANVAVKARIGTDGLVSRPTLAGRYRCYMHPAERSEHPGVCPICGMDLELVTHEHAAAAENPTVLAVPESAILSTGTRHVVYLRTKPGRYELREVRVGVRADGFVHIQNGLEDGDVVATRGNFLLDSQMQLTGKPSLFVPGGGAGGGGHVH